MDQVQFNHPHPPAVMGIPYGFPLAVLPKTGERAPFEIHQLEWKTSLVARVVHRADHGDLISHPGQRIRISINNTPHPVHDGEERVGKLADPQHFISTPTSYYLTKRGKKQKILRSGFLPP